MFSDNHAHWCHMPTIELVKISRQYPMISHLLFCYHKYLLFTLCHIYIRTFPDQPAGNMAISPCTISWMSHLNYQSQTLASRETTDALNEQYNDMVVSVSEELLGIKQLSYSVFEGKSEKR